MTSLLEAVPSARKPVPGNVQFVGGLHPLDELVFQQENVFATTGVALSELRLSLIREAFEYHYEACPPYRRYCEVAGVSPLDVRAYDDLFRIPLLPTSLFKKKELVSVAPADIAKVCLSSGTQGGQSRVSRDQRSLERLLGSVRQGLSVLDREVDRERHVFVLGPDTDEARDLWFSYVLSIVDFLHPTDFYVRGDCFEPAALLRDLAALPPGPQPLLVGPPFLFVELAAAARELGLRVNLAEREGMIITAGGWKRHQGQALSRESLDELVVTGLGVARTHIRDTFNMVELNSVLFECEAGAKHVPPWLFATARDATSLSPLAPGAEGLLAYCDPLATSYPCFILTDDVGRVSADQRCACGRFGNSITISRRVARVEARGCALKLDRSLSQQRTETA
jgi:long-chain-fatty-acid---luciferin-component ligase